MIHRHLEVPPETATEDLPSAAIVDLIERGDLDDWRPIARSLARDPFGDFAERVARLIDEYPVYGASPLWRAFIARARARTGFPPRPPRPTSLAALRRKQRLTQVDLADRMGMTQSDLSKFERRRDVRLSTLRAYLGALGAELTLLSEVDGERLEIRLTETGRGD